MIYQPSNKKSIRNSTTNKKWIIDQKINMDSNE